MSKNSVKTILITLYLSAVQDPEPHLDIWGQKSIFCLVIAIFVDGANDHNTRGSNFPIGTTPKKFSVSELGVIFWGSPLFLAVFGH